MIERYESAVGPLRLAAEPGGLTEVSPWREPPEGAQRRGAPSGGDPPDERARRHLEDARRWLDAYFAGASELPPLPALQPQGTLFQRAVWRKLLEVPLGDTVSYGEIAARLRAEGRKASAQAVGRAVGANHIAILVPCHRVVGADGGLTGYAYGLPMKEWLLAHERDAGIERHPLEPFLPDGAQTLFLGSFPPPRSRWSMDFFYPNYSNDFWRIMGLLHFGDAAHFEVRGEKHFDRESIVAFARERGLAFFDTAVRVKRLRGNASDAFLEIVEPTDVASLVAWLPSCTRIVTTGGKATGELLAQLGLDAAPPLGGCVQVELAGRRFTWWRMPSTSRAYPLSLARKAAFYEKLNT